jgi:hypothetical protein
MNEIEEAVLETVSEKYLMPKASDTGPPIGILHRNRKGAAIISPLTAHTAVRSATSRMTDGIRSGFARLFADGSPMTRVRLPMLPMLPKPLDPT